MGKPYGYWTIEKIQKESLKYGNRWEFKKNSPGAHKAARKKGILAQMYSHMGATKNEPWTPEELHTEALKYHSRFEFSRGSSHAYHISIKIGILDKICSHMDSPHMNWTDDLIHSEALKYTTRTGFAKNSTRAYNMAIHRGILDMVCSHMAPVYESWTIDLLKEEALKYNERIKFLRNSKSAYESARLQGILDEICAHMKPAKGPSLAERELLAIIKDIYGDSKKLMDRKVKIDGKPYIYGFEIDIFIPSLMKGIEFDGTYYHSFKFMRNSVGKRFWSDDDIRNYDLIKDSWFLTKNIKILHIREEDWNLNKEGCIKLCLEFLAPNP